MSRTELSPKRPRTPINADFLRRKVSESVGGKGLEISGAVVDPGCGRPDDPVVIPGNSIKITDMKSEIDFRDFEFKGPLALLNHWALLSFHHTLFSDLTISADISQFFIGNKSGAMNIEVSDSTIDAFFLYDSRFLGKVVFKKTSLRILFLKRIVIEGDLDLSGVVGLRHLALIKVNIHGKVIAPTHPQMRHIADDLRREFGDKVVFKKK